jgi:hypothetical protein
MRRQIYSNHGLKLTVIKHRYTRKSRKTQKRLYIDLFQGRRDRWEITYIKAGRRSARIVVEIKRAASASKLGQKS